MPLLSKAMFIKRLIGPDDSNFLEKEDPSWLDIEAAIRRLNGETSTLLIIAAGDPVPHMGIGGGSGGKYVVYATPDNLTFHNLINPNSPTGSCSLKAGGQWGKYALKMCVDLSHALRAAKTYADSGRCDDGLAWETDK